MYMNWHTCNDHVLANLPPPANIPVPTFPPQTVMKTCTQLLVTKHDVPAEDLTDWYKEAPAGEEEEEEEEGEEEETPKVGTLLQGGVDPANSAMMLKRNTKPAFGWTRSDSRHPHKVGVTISATQYCRALWQHNHLAVNIYSRNLIFDKTLIISGEDDGDEEEGLRYVLPGNKSGHWEGKGGTAYESVWE